MNANPQPLSETSYDVLPDPDPGSLVIRILIQAFDEQKLKNFTVKKKIKHFFKSRD